MAKDYARPNRGASSRGRRDAAEGGRNWRWPLAGILIALFAIGIFYLKQQSDKLAVEQGDEGTSMVQRTMKKSTQEETVSRPVSTNKKSTTQQQPAAVQPSSPPQPKFDFYTMLPKGQAANTGVKTTPPPPAVATAPVTTSPTVTKSIAAPIAKAPTAKQPSTKQLEKNAQADASDLIAVEIQKLGADKDKAAKAKTASHYIVQLGVFKNYNDADQLKAKMVLQGFEVSIKDFKKQNTALYRVYMGAYPSLAAAKKQQHLLEENQVKSKVARE